MSQTLHQRFHGRQPFNPTQESSLWAAGALITTLLALLILLLSVFATRAF
jgi:hypothetical protein